jgi:hypothetical protein
MFLSWLAAYLPCLIRIGFSKEKSQKLHFELHVMLSFFDPNVFKLIGSLFALLDQDWV